MGYGLRQSIESYRCLVLQLELLDDPLQALGEL